MKNKLKLLLIICSLFSLQMTAQEKKTLSLTEAVDLGLQNSKQLKINKAKIEEATAAAKEATERRLPDAKASASYLRLNAVNAELKTKNNNNGGGSGTPVEQPKISQALYGLVNVSLPIYTGGKIRYGIESSKFLEKAEMLNAENDKEEVIQNTIEAFANLFKAKTAVRLVQENLNEAQQRTKELTGMEKNGLLARNDLLKSQLRESNMEFNLSDAENSWQLANVNMNLMLGLPTTTELILDTTGLVKKEDNRVLDDYLNAAKINRKDIEAIDLRKKAAESGVKSAKGDLYPSLALTGGYIGLDIPDFISVPAAMNVGVGVSYNIGSLWKNKSKVQQAEARVKQLTFTEEMMDDNIRLEVNRSYLSLMTNRKKIEVSAKAVEQAEENYRIVKNKFDNSLATTTDLLDADIAQLQARLSYTLARADAFVAYHKLLQTSGLLSAELKK
ncbi:MAG TPA: TolC family protein [Chitinophagaceae bacterium]|nr:TolC family protein [Chitinophagaceae bacterium]